MPCNAMQCARAYGTVTHRDGCVRCGLTHSASAAGTLDSIAFQHWGPEAIVGKPFDRQQQVRTHTHTHAPTRGHVHAHARSHTRAHDGTRTHCGTSGCVRNRPMG
jgi:hypothetical protein